MIPRFAMTLEEYARCWKKLADGIQPMIRDKMERDVPQFEEYIREQLYSGVDGDESPLIPGYTEDPYFKKLMESIGRKTPNAIKIGRQRYRNRNLHIWVFLQEGTILQTLSYVEIFIVPSRQYQYQMV